MWIDGLDLCECDRLKLCHSFAPLLEMINEVAWGCHAGVQTIHKGVLQNHHLVPENVYFVVIQLGYNTIKLHQCGTIKLHQPISLHQFVFAYITLPTPTDLPLLHCQHQPNCIRLHQQHDQFALLQHN